MSDLSTLIRRPRPAPPPPALLEGLRALAELPVRPEGPPPNDPRRAIEAIIAELDRIMGEMIERILHHPEYQALEATWRGARLLLDGAEGDSAVKIRLFDISKRELARTLRKFRGTAWDQSPLFRRIYDEEFGQFGGQPFGVLVGDYAFDHSAPDVTLLSDIARIAAAAHVPFIAAAAPSLMQMDSWSELANPRDISRLFRTPEYTAWRALRQAEDTRYIGLCLPRFLARLPYGYRTEPVDAFAFEEEVDGPDDRNFLWANPAYAMASNIARAFRLYGWCVRIRGIDGGGLVQGLPEYHFPTADGDADPRCSVEIALSERRESELAANGLIPLVHLRNGDGTAFVGASSLQEPAVYDDRDATANATMSARLPYIFATCRFAHYLKCMVRDKIGSAMDGPAIERWLQSWINSYVDGSPQTSSDEHKASHPLADASIKIESRPDQPGTYEAKFFIRPHYQLEASTATVRLLSKLAGPS